MSRTDRHPLLTGDASLTQTLRQLSVPLKAGDLVDDLEEQNLLLFCRDKNSRKWAPRWLGQAGFSVEIPVEGIDALEQARADRPDIIVVEASLPGSSGIPLYQELLDAADLDCPVFVLCNTSRELSGALETDAFDVVRKPFEWQIIAPRVKRAAELRRLGSQLEERDRSLSQALDLADAARERLRSRESFEPVTGLPNKAKFKDLLSRGMAAVDRDGNKLAVVVIGFNRFRLVVEAMGQDHADLVMAEVGRSICDSIRDTDREAIDSPGINSAAAASIDQFRFAILFSYSGQDAELLSLQHRLVENLAQPIHIAGQTIYLSACLGISVYPGDARDPDSLLQRADNAMRDAQARGGGFKYYCTETDAAAARRLRTEHMLHEALDRRELQLAFQPINSVASGDVFSAEALLRWPQPDGTFISPAEFVPVAEDSGLMIRVGDYVLHEACRRLAEWRKDGYELDYIAVNVSRVQLAAGDFVSKVRAVLERHRLPAESLALELSERGVLSGDTEFLAQLRQLQAAGVRIAIDDFGTGESAISYLMDLPVDILKIDRSFVSGIAHDGKEAAIASAMIALGQRLGLAVVAEGVERDEQLQALKDLGCDAFQGFIVSQALLEGGLLGFLTKRRSD